MTANVLLREERSHTDLPKTLSIYEAHYDRKNLLLYYSKARVTEPKPVSGSSPWYLQTPRVWPGIV